MNSTIDFIKSYFEDVIVGFNVHSCKTFMSVNSEMFGIFVLSAIKNIFEEKSISDFVVNFVSVCISLPILLCLLISNLAMIPIGFVLSIIGLPFATLSFVFKVLPRTILEHKRHN